MALKLHDLAIVVRLLAPDGDGLSYAALARDTGLSKSEAHEAVGRARAARLLAAEKLVVQRESLEAFLVHGLRFAYAASVGGEDVEGVALAGAPQYVWPVKGGPDRGIALDPLYKGCIEAAALPHMKRWLSALEVMRLHDDVARAHAARFLREQLTTGPSEAAERGSPLTRTQPVDAEKAAIVAAAEQVVVRRGFEHASHAEIAARAKVDPAAVGAVFPDHGTLQRVIFERVASGALEFLGPVFTYGKDVGPERLEQCLAGFLGYCEANERFYRILAWVHAESHLGFNASVREASSFMVERLTESIAAASDAQDLVDAQARTHLFLTFPDLYNVVRWNYLDRLDDRFDKPAIAARVKRLVESALLRAIVSTKI